MSKSPTKNTIDYSYWCGLSVCPLRCLVWLALGEDPDKHPDEDPHGEWDPKKAWHQATSAYKGGEIKYVKDVSWEVRPIDFFEWAIDKKLKDELLFPNIPEALKTFVTGAKESQRMHGELAVKSRHKHLVVAYALASSNRIDIYKADAAGLILRAVERRDRGTVSKRFVTDLVRDMRAKLDPPSN